MASDLFFKFEADFVESLRCIPMGVRCKLDTCGIKLKLHHWHQLSQAERQQLVTAACDTPATIQAYREWLQQRVVAVTGELPQDLPVDPEPVWLQPIAIPPQVQEQAIAWGVSLTLEQWQGLTPLQRFALIKLSRPSHESKNFYPALQEFGLVQ